MPHLFIALLWIIPLWSFAEEPPETEKETPEAAEATWLDNAHTFLSGRIELFANQMDSFFGERRMEEESTGTFVKLTFTSLTTSGEATTLTPSLGVRLRLPKTEEKLRLVITSEADRLFEQTEEQPAATPGEENIQDTTFFEPEIFTTALEYVFKSTRTWNVSAKTGLEWEQITPNPFYSARVRRHFQVPLWQIRFTQRAGWYALTGFEEETSLDFEHKITPDTLARFSGALLWSEKIESIQFTQTNSLFQRLGPKSAFVYSVGLLGNNKPDPHIVHYQTSVGWRYALYKAWAFIEAQPGITMPASRDYSAVPSFTLILQSIFG